MGIRDVLETYKLGKISSEEAEKLLRMDYLERIGRDYVLDRSRFMRKGIPEVVYGASKTPAKVAEICASRPADLLLVSKAGREHFEAVKEMDEFVRSRFTPENIAKITVDLPRGNVTELENLIKEGDSVSIDDAIRNAVREYTRARAKNQ